MKIEIEELNDNTLSAAVDIWNSVVKDGRAFPQEECLTNEEGKNFFGMQSYTGVAKDTNTNEVLGMYILHPNNVGRCKHLCNASYAVKKDKRGLHIGEELVKDCMKKAKDKGFKVLQFNAVVKSNKGALALYEKLGFIKLGVIPGGFYNIDGEYEDIIPHYITL